MFYFYYTGVYARRIARELKVTAFYPNENLLRERKGKLSRKTARNINWGCGLSVMERINAPDSTLNRNISTAISKVKTFDALNAAGILCPPYSRTPNELASEGRYLGRKDFGTGGEGIVIYEKEQLPAEGVSHQFYVAFIPKLKEFRIHVFMGQVICEQIKYIPNGSGVLIRNYANGARFCGKPLEQEVSTDKALEARDAAIRAVQATGLDFGAVDLLIKRNKGGVEGPVYVLEVNTAPGLTNSEIEESIDNGMPRTYVAYLEAMRRLLV